MYLCMYAYVMAEFCMHFLASLRNKEKNAVFAIIAIWWGRGGVMGLYGMGGEWGKILQYAYLLA